MDLLNGPSEEQLIKIKKELNEDNDRFNNNLELLKSWLSYQEYLPKYDTKTLTIFLRGCKQDLERTKRKLECYYSVRKTIPEIFGNRSTISDEFQASVNAMAIVPLKNLNDDGARVMACKLISNDPNLFNIVDIVRLFCMIGDIRVSEEFPIIGDIIIMDCGKNFTAMHIAKSINFIVGKGVTVANEAYPQRIKRIHVLNLPEYGEKFMIFMKSFMKEKIRNRFIVHRKPEELLEYINPEILPNEYGGKGGELIEMHKEWREYLVEKNSWFKEQENIAAVGPLPKHILQSCAFDSQEGIQGSFRKLAID